ncbi:MAG: hypothetical protein IPJ66_17325 [Bacteroidetes bacterium]|nr:hypothetical protein [Bacteroidota bacterium]
MTAYLWSNGTTTSAITTGTNSIYSVTAYNSNGCSATSANVTVSIKEINTTPGVSVSKCYGGSGADYSVSSIGDHPHLINPDGSHVFCGIINSSDGQVTVIMVVRMDGL